MKTSLWMVMLVVVAWVAFMIGYSVSALTGVHNATPATPALAGGYGAKPAKQD